jgi:hypothetical protein
VKQKRPPRSLASRSALPPEGPIFVLGRPGDKKSPHAFGKREDF